MSFSIFNLPTKDFKKLTPIYVRGQIKEFTVMTNITFTT